MLIIDAPSPNFGPRKDGKKIRHIILHYTGSPTTFEALRLLQGGEKDHQVSAHYLIDTDGTITRLVAEEMRAWHAGKSFWAGEEDINSTSIGIEIQNGGHEYGYTPFPDAQIKAVTQLCQGIIKRHSILPQNILAHSDIAPLRKTDPGELFPWAFLAENGVGLYPDINSVKIDPEFNLIATLHKIGYDHRLDDKTLIAAFQRHYQPNIFKNPALIGIANLNTAQLAADLWRQYQENRPKYS